MSEKLQPAIQPTANSGGKQSEQRLKVTGPKRDFLVAATNMSWQLALVVLVPVIGGVKIDEHLRSFPLGTIVGFVLAMIGMSLVVWRQLQLLSPKIVATTKSKAQKT